MESDEGGNDMVTAADVLREAAGLLSEQGENPEYDRAIVELTTRLLGRSDADKPEMLVQIRGGGTPE